LASNGSLYIIQTINELKENTGGIRIGRGNYNVGRKAYLGLFVYHKSHKG
jgi:hypothetical protein